MEHVLTQLILLDMRPIVSNFERPISLNGRKLADGRLQFCTLMEREGEGGRHTLAVIHGYTHTHTHTCTHASTHTYMYAHTHTHIRTHKEADSDKCHTETNAHQ